MTKVVIYVGGGMVQDVVCDAEGIQVMVVDYDVENDCGMIERGLESIRVDAVLVEQTISQTENPLW